MYEAMCSGGVPRSEDPTESSASSRRFSTPKGGLNRDSFDGDYVRRLTEGDPDTERHFAQYFGDLLLIKLRVRLRQPQLIEDLRQETFVRVLAALKTTKRLHSPESLGAFVNSVCNNLLFEMYRRDSHQKTFETDDPFDPPDDQVSIESRMVTQESCEAVRKTLEELPTKDRELLRMVFYEDLDRNQICRTFNVDREYLRVLMHRAKARFRECLLRRYSQEGHARVS